MATSEVYVEVGDERSTPNNFATTYSFTVCTLEYLRSEMERNPGTFYVSRALIVVAQFTDEAIRPALEWTLPRIEEVGVRKD